MTNLDRITQQPGMMGGKPCIRGMLTNVKSTSPTHETAGRHEPVARWVDLLTRSQFEAVHWSSVGSPHALDQEIHGEKPSVIQIRSENLSPDVIGVQTIKALRQLADQLNEMYRVGNRTGHYRAFPALLRNAASWQAATREYQNIGIPVLLVWGARTIGRGSANANPTCGSFQGLA